MLIGFTVGLLITLLGLAIGMTAGYLGGFADGLLNVFTNVFLIIPALPLLITLASFLPPGIVTVTFVLTITSWAWPARVFRSQTLSLREKDFVSASVVSGEGTFRIIFSEILPNMMSLVVSSFFGNVIYAIGADVGLAFLGFENVTTVSWGTMLYWSQNNSALLQGAWWTFVPPGLVHRAGGLCHHDDDLRRGRDHQPASEDREGDFECPSEVPYRRQSAPPRSSMNQPPEPAPSGCKGSAGANT